MITAVDTSVLLDLFLPDPKFADASSAALREADAAGSMIVCEIVYAELPNFCAEMSSIMLSLNWTFASIRWTRRSLLPPAELSENIATGAGLARGFYPTF